MNDSIGADNIGVASSRQRSSEPGTMTTTCSLDSPRLDQQESARPTEEASPRRHRRTTAVSWYGKLPIVSMLLAGAAWEVFKWIIAVITLD